MIHHSLNYFVALNLVLFYLYLLTNTLYVSAVWTKIVPNFMIQGGDFTMGNGVGGERYVLLSSFHSITKKIYFDKLLSQL
jgi:cyclophilin family peptidyl-prolyl cis-trans isomerase